MSFCNNGNPTVFGGKIFRMIVSSVVGINGGYNSPTYYKNTYEHQQKQSISWLHSVVLTLHFR